MRSRFFIVCAALLAMGTAFALAAADLDFAPPVNARASTKSKDVNNGIQATLRVAGDLRRVPLNHNTAVVGELTGALPETNQVQLWVNNRLAGQALARPTGLDSIFADRSSPGRMNAVFVWRPNTAGNHELVAKIVTASGNVFVSAPVMVEVADIPPPKLVLLERPRDHMFSSDEFNVVLQGTDADGQATTIKLIRDDLKEFFVTNTPVLAIHRRTTPAGIYVFEAQAVDDNGLFSEPLSFTCVVDPTERPPAAAPSDLFVEPVLLPGQTQPGKNVRIAGAPHALQLRWHLPPNAAELAGTLVQRFDNESSIWKTVAILEKGACEWRDRGLRSEQNYRYRIAFMCDEFSRTPFSAEAAETTGVILPFYGVLQIPSR
jgi:hypothetical protein